MESKIKENAKENANLSTVLSTLHPGNEDGIVHILSKFKQVLLSSLRNVQIL